MTPDDLVTMLGRYRFRFGAERQLQGGIALMLTAEGVPFERERVLGGGRVDFLVQGIALEVKVAGTADAARRQLERYAKDDAVEGLVLCTSRWQVSRQPDEMSGKPVRVFTIARGLG